MSRLRNFFHIEIPLRSLFEHSTVAGLAERIENLREQQGRAVFDGRPEEREEIRL
jgi:hypothetical protein